MVALLLTGPLVGISIAASTHALTDLQRRPGELWPYVGLLLPPPRAGTTVAFALSSLHHFASDVGWLPSIGMHLMFGALAWAHLELSSTLLCVYYLGVHVPPHFVRAWRQNRRQASIMAALTVGLACRFAGTRTLVLTDRMQQVVVSHVLVGASTDSNT